MHEFENVFNHNNRKKFLKQDTNALTIKNIGRM